MTLSFRAGLLSLALLTSPLPALAEEFSPVQRDEIINILRAALKQDPSILRDAIAALQADESAREQAATKSAIASMKDSLVAPNDPEGGNPKGDVTIVEFFDVRCGYCKRLEPVMAQFLDQDRNVRVVYKDLPILGPASVLAAKALLAAQKQNGYEKLREALMKLPTDVSMASIQTEAQKLGLDWTRLSKDMDDPLVKQRIDANLALAHSLGIQGTPAMVIGNDLIPGAVGLSELKRVVARARAAG
jgi:protein-disulfide isomerase